MNVSAFAKINFGLHITGKRADGFHNLETLFVRVGIRDNISLNPAERDHLTCSEPGIPTDATNLCLKAAEVLRKEYSLDPARYGVRITLEKHIPTGAGLGGGSADAAATLHGLTQLWNLPAHLPTLLRLGAQLGSDVPFFVQPSAMAYGTGRGEILEPVSTIMPYWLVVVFPGVHVSTSWAYGNLQIGNHSAVPLRELLPAAIEDPEIMRREIRNDFEPLVFQHYPAIAGVRDMLLRANAVFAQLSGSGAAVYGLFQYEPVYDWLKSQFPASYQVFISPPNFDPTA